MQLTRGAPGILGILGIPRVPHRMLCSTVAHATVGLRPAAAPAAEAFPEPVPVHLPGRLLAGSFGSL